MRRAFTLIELLVVIAIISILISMTLPALGTARNMARALKCSAGIRSAHQGLVMWSQSHQDEFPLPSRLDLNDATMSADCATEKDNSGNIFSILNYGDYFRPELSVCPSEKNPDIVRDEGYQTKLPQSARIAAGALWDPGFAGPPGESGTTGIGGGRRGGGRVGHLSYAHATPFGNRARAWSATLNPSEPIVADRGPRYTGSAGAWAPVPGASGADSNTMLTHGSPRQWDGNVGYGDGHVSFETRPDPAIVKIVYATDVNGARHHSDNIFANENDATSSPLNPDERPDVGSNALLRGYSDVRCISQGGVVISPFVD